MTTEEFKSRMLPYARRLYPLVKRILCSEEETRDALQELMIKLWNKRHDLQNCSNLDGFVATVARNFCFDLKKERKLPLLDPADEGRMVAPLAENDLEIREKLEHVHQIMKKLPDKYREVLQLREIEGFSFEEIRALTGYEIPYIRVLLSRSRMKVREELIKIYDYERGTCQPA